METEKAKLENELKAAQARLDAAKEQAKAIETRGKAEAAIITAQNEAEVAGLAKAVAGFTSPEQFAQYHVLSKLAPALSEIFASDTSEFAKVFSTYMSPAAKKGPEPYSLGSDSHVPWCRCICSIGGTLPSGSTRLARMRVM